MKRPHLFNQFDMCNMSLFKIKIMPVFNLYARPGVGSTTSNNKQSMLNIHVCKHH